MRLKIVYIKIAILASALIASIGCGDTDLTPAWLDDILESISPGGDSSVDDLLENPQDKGDKESNDPCVGIPPEYIEAIDDPFDPCFSGSITGGDGGPIQANCHDADGDGFYAGPQCSKSLVLDCDDTKAYINPGTTEVDGNAIDEDCVDNDFDNDQFDGYGRGGTDCNDDDPEINPRAIEIEGNFIDENCIDNDADGDFYDSLESGGTDCDDSNDRINPLHQEVCGNEWDDNCDGIKCTIFIRPVNGTRTVPPSVIIDIQASEPLVENYSIALSTNGQLVETNDKIYSDRTTVRVTPKFPLKFETEYLIDVYNGLEVHHSTFTTAKARDLDLTIPIQDNRNRKSPRVFDIKFNKIEPEGNWSFASPSLLQGKYFGKIVVGASHISTGDYSTGTFIFTKARPITNNGIISDIDFGDEILQYSAEITGPYFVARKGNGLYKFGGRALRAEKYDWTGKFVVNSQGTPRIENGKIKLFISNCLDFCRAALPVCDETCVSQLRCSFDEIFIYTSLITSCGNFMTMPLQMEISFDGTAVDLVSREFDVPQLTGAGGEGSPRNMVITPTEDSPLFFTSNFFNISPNAAIYQAGLLRTYSQAELVYVDSRNHQTADYQSWIGCDDSKINCEVEGPSFNFPLITQLAPGEEELYPGVKYDLQVLVGVYGSYWPGMQIYKPE